MIVSFPNTSSNIKECDVIAITIEEKFIGYGEVLIVLSDCVLLSLDRHTAKFFDTIFNEGIQCDVQLF